MHDTVCRQTLVVVIAGQHNCRCCGILKADERCLHLAELDTHPPQFDLIVTPSHEKDIAVSPAPADVAGQIHHAFSRSRCASKTPGRCIFITPVTGTFRYSRNRDLAQDVALQTCRIQQQYLAARQRNTNR